MAYLKCTCGERRHVHKTYLPDQGETGSFVCSRCGKEWEMYGTKKGVDVRPVTKDEGPRRQGEF